MGTEEGMDGNIIWQGACASAGRAFPTAVITATCKPRFAPAEAQHKELDKQILIGQIIIRKIITFLYHGSVLLFHAPPSRLD